MKTNKEIQEKYRGLFTAFNCCYGIPLDFIEKRRNKLEIEEGIKENLYWIEIPQTKKSENKMYYLIKTVGEEHYEEYYMDDDERVEHLSFVTPEEIFPEQAINVLDNGDMLENIVKNEKIEKFTPEMAQDALTFFDRLYNEYYSWLKTQRKEVVTGRQLKICEDVIT